MATKTINLVGIVNVTPDSFSDGGRYLAYDAAVAHAHHLLADGADLIEIGGDSTRPGSDCIGIEQEWRRIEGVVKEVASFAPVSIDTHHAEVAHRSLELGAKMINDISAGDDPELFSVVAGTEAKLVLMYSRCQKPHRFDPPKEGDILTHIKEFFQQKIEQALAAGVREEQLIIDTGMGAFIHDKPQVSWGLIHRYQELLDEPLFASRSFLFGSSRKGFLKEEGEEEIAERDPLSALSGFIVAQKLYGRAELYIRTHNVKMQRSFLRHGLDVVYI